MASKASELAVSWITANGPRELEQLFRAVVYHHTVPILITDNDRRCHEASIGAAKLFGIPRQHIVGKRIDDFADPAVISHIVERWPGFPGNGEQEGTFRVADVDGTLRHLTYAAKENVLPVRHVLVLRGTTGPVQPNDPRSTGKVGPFRAPDYALLLLDAEGAIVSWYGGTNRIYGYSQEQAIGNHVSMLFSADEDPIAGAQQELGRAALGGHFARECWQQKADGSRFWANIITMALRDADGELRGYAQIVRDFTERHERDEKLRRDRARLRSFSVIPTIAGIASGEFDRILEANDAFLSLVGYTLEDLRAGGLNWQDLSPPESDPLDDLAHEEVLRFGACTPYEKDLVRRDGTRVPVLVATAVVKLSPFRWITFVQDLRERDLMDRVADEDVAVKQDIGEIVGNGAGLQRVLRQVEVVAPTDANVLILGETGTGKELVARAIHRLSPRKNLPFVTLNCAAIPTGLLESELFGYEKGAFTGALAQKIGRFEMAHRGTLFLDEVGDIPLDLQPKLLRALQEKSFERLGGTRTIPIDVRLVAATNRDLTEMMGDKLFRSDLYYRLKVFPITTPPLRDRAEDIPILVRHFTQKYARAMHKQIDKIPTETMRALVGWPWPGNVRELENFIERAVILSPGTTLRPPLEEIRPNTHTLSGTSTLEQVQRTHILKVLREAGGVVSKAAARLGIPRTTLNALMSKLGVSRKDL